MSVSESRVYAQILAANHVDAHTRIGMLDALRVVYANRVTNPFDMTAPLSTAFSWARSPQGYEYWGQQNDLLEGHPIKKKEKKYAAIYD